VLEINSKNRLSFLVAAKASAAQTPRNPTGRKKDNPKITPKKAKKNNCKGRPAFRIGKGLSPVREGLAFSGFPKKKNTRVKRTKTEDKAAAPAGSKRPVIWR
jgi:hypothetical protein